MADIGHTHKLYWPHLCNHDFACQWQVPDTCCQEPYIRHLFSAVCMLYMSNTWTLLAGPLCQECLRQLLRISWYDWICHIGEDWPGLTRSSPVLPMRLYLGLMKMLILYLHVVMSHNWFPDHFRRHSTGQIPNKYWRSNSHRPFVDLEESRFVIQWHGGSRRWLAKC